MSRGYLAKCQNKVRHADKQAAMAARRSLIACKGDWTMGNSNVYSCNACGFWHTGRIGRVNRGRR